MNMLRLFKNSKKHDFELDSIGSLAESSFAQMVVKVLSLKRGFTVSTENIDNETFIAVFESARTKLTLVYGLDGKFVSKKSEIFK